MPLPEQGWQPANLFMDYTAQKYFGSIRESRFPDASLNIATVCLTYLSLDVFAEGCCSTDEIFEDRLQQYPLCDYAARYWADHTHGNAEQDIEVLALSFLIDNFKVSSSSQVLFSSTYRYDGYSQQNPNGFPGCILLLILA